jgi:hypothetical protein
MESFAKCVYRIFLVGFFFFNIELQFCLYESLSSYIYRNRLMIEGLGVTSFSIGIVNRQHNVYFIVARTVGIMSAKRKR